LINSSLETRAVKGRGALSRRLKDDVSKFKPTLRTLSLMTNKTGKAENRIEYADKMTSNE